jgi:Zn-dependent alcohol dehydrogenase
MRAVVPGFGQPLVIEDRPVPEPGPRQVVVRMEASGLCHTDIHAANGDWPVTPTVPFIPGHEGVGIVTAVGEGVTSPRPGQRVAVPWLGYACGTCQFCLIGWETLCLSQSAWRGPRVRSAGRGGTAAARRGGTRPGRVTGVPDRFAPGRQPLRRSPGPPGWRELPMYPRTATSVPWPGRALI